MHSPVLAPSGRQISGVAVRLRDQGEVESRPLSSFLDGESIYSSGETAGQAYRVEYGAVRVYRVLANGRRQILAFYFGGSWFGLQNECRHRSTAEAIGSTGVKSINLQKNPHVWQGLLPAVLENFLSSQEHQLVIGRQSAVERVAAFLLEMSQRSGPSHRFELFMPRVDIADYLGLTIETVSRSLTKLKNKGIIKLHGARGIEIVEYGMLERLCL